jgi:hypothetical protein
VTRPWLLWALAAAIFVAWQVAMLVDGPFGPWAVAGFALLVVYVAACVRLPAGR